MRGQPRVGEDVAVLRRLAVGQERRGGCADRRQLLVVVLPLVGHELRDGESVARVADRRLQRLASVMVPNRVSSWCQPSTTPGTSTESGPLPGICGEAAPRELLGRRRVRGAAGRVEAVDLLGLRVVDDREQVAADAVHARLDDGEHRRGGDGGVDRVAAVLQHLEPGRRRQRWLVAIMPWRADGRRARAAKVAGRAVAGLNR